MLTWKIRMEARATSHRTSRGSRAAAARRCAKRLPACRSALLLLQPLLLPLPLLLLLPLRLLLVRLKLPVQTIRASPGARVCFTTA
jgi:hypothetical protein